MRYFFSCEGAQTFRDESGTELADDHCARVQAVHNASETMSDHAGAFVEVGFWRMTVTDDTGRVAFRVHFQID